ncbi:unnamed protein product [Sphagnum balticum]
MATTRSQQRGGGQAPGAQRGAGGGGTGFAGRRRGKHGWPSRQDMVAELLKLPITLNNLYHAPNSKHHPGWLVQDHPNRYPVKKDKDGNEQPMRLDSQIAILLHTRGVRGTGCRRRVANRHTEFVDEIVCEAVFTNPANGQQVRIVDKCSSCYYACDSLGTCGSAAVQGNAPAQLPALIIAPTQPAQANPAPLQPAALAFQINAPLAHSDVATTGNDMEEEEEEEEEGDEEGDETSEEEDGDHFDYMMVDEDEEDGFEGDEFGQYYPSGPLLEAYNSQHDDDMDFGGVLEQNVPGNDSHEEILGRLSGNFHPYDQGHALNSFPLEEEYSGFYLEMNETYEKDCILRRDNHIYHKNNEKLRTEAAILRDMMAGRDEFSATQYHRQRESAHYCDKDVRRILYGLGHDEFGGLDGYSMAQIEEENAALCAENEQLKKNIAAMKPWVGK